MLQSRKLIASAPLSEQKHQVISQGQARRTAVFGSGTQFKGSHLWQGCGGRGTWHMGSPFLETWRSVGSLGACLLYSQKLIPSRVFQMQHDQMFTSYPNSPQPQHSPSPFTLPVCRPVASILTWLASSLQSYDQKAQVANPRLLFCFLPLFFLSGASGHCDHRVLWNLWVRFSWGFHSPLASLPKRCKD